MFTLAAPSAFVIGLLVVGFIVISLMMILTVLIQRPTGGGLSGAFGSSSEGAGQTAFGARTGDALTVATVTMFIVFLGFAIGLNFAVTPPTAAEAAEAAAEPPAPIEESIPVIPPSQPADDPAGDEPATEGEGG
jgi:preprotein translocase subunit SecG